MSETNNSIRLPKKSIDEWLNNVDYSYLSSPSYIPSDFSLMFMNFIKLVNGEQGESHKTPPVHLAMLDKVGEGNEYIVNLCHRGMGKTAIFGEYLPLYIAVFEEIPGLGKVESMIYIADSMDNGAKSARKNIEFRYNNSEFLQEWLPEAKFTDSYIEFKNKNGHVFGMKLFGATTGLRGTKIFGKRPILAVLDDLISDEAAKSKTVMNLIKDTVYKGVNHALDPTKRRVIFNGTPFNKDDIIIEAVESGAWSVNVWPVCEHFPCSKERFRGSWPDRFTYRYIKNQYELAEKTGKLSSFYQELMLRIASDDERLIQDEEIRWYSRKSLLENKGAYNFYITTDFATSSKDTADFSVISVWAYNSNGDWFWVDGICVRQTMDKNVDDLFKFISEYSPQSVGIEVTGQQGAFIQWLQSEQMKRNIWFNFASSSKTNTPGIRPTTDKLSRFNLVVPWFKAGKMYFPTEAKETNTLREFMQEIQLATVNGIKSKDDCLDTISMLAFIKAWKPSIQVNLTQNDSGEWEDREQYFNTSNLSSYIV